MIIEASCSCNIGKIRSNNEDNLYFNGYYMEKDNNGLSSAKTTKANTDSKPMFCVFDGMGGEAAGEVASHLAAKYTDEYLKANNNDLLSGSSSIENWCFFINNNVFEASKEISRGNVGTTMVSLYFDRKQVYISNIGDSPAFRIRGTEIVQLSTDHVEKLPPTMKHHKPRLIQNIGVDPTELLIEPSIVKETIKKNDIYLLCSDGLTDMLTPEEILADIKNHASVKKSAEVLVEHALKRGGKDNVTVMLCKIK